MHAKQPVNARSPVGGAKDMLWAMAALPDRRGTLSSAKECNNGSRQ